LLGERRGGGCNWLWSILEVRCPRLTLFQMRTASAKFLLREALWHNYAAVVKQ